jgi:hypothetical protein
MMWKLVEQDGRLRRVGLRGVAKRLPHVHHGQTNAPCLLFAQLLVELPHALLGAVLAAEPDRPVPDQVAHHNAVGVALPDRDFVDANRLGSRRASLGKLRAHVLLLQSLDRLPVQIQFFGNVLDGADPTATPDEPGEALRVERIVGKKIELLAHHLATGATVNPTDLELHIDPGVAAGQIARSPRRTVVPAHVRPITFLAYGFFERRTIVTTRAKESPNTPPSCSRDESQETDMRQEDACVCVQHIPELENTLMHDPEAIWVEANIKETDLASIRLGQSAAVNVDAYPGRVFEARVSLVGNSATSAFALLPNPNPSGSFTKITQRIPIRLAIRQEGLLLKPGMMVVPPSADRTGQETCGRPQP